MRRLVTPRWIAVHLGVLAAVAAFLGLGWWQLNRAAAGNALSFGYAIEWPVFAAFVVAVWIVEMRKVVRGGTAEAPTVRVQEQAVRSQQADEPQPVRRRRPRNEAAYDDSDDPQLAAYNHYLAWLNSHPHANPADYPGMPAPRPERTGPAPRPERTGPAADPVPANVPATSRTSSPPDWRPSARVDKIARESS